MAFVLREAVEVTRAVNGVHLAPATEQVDVTYRVVSVVATESGVSADVHRSYDGGDVWSIYGSAALPNIMTLQEAEEYVAAVMSAQ